MSLPPYNDTRNAARIPYHEAQQRIKGTGAIAGGAGLAIGGDIGRQQRQDQGNPLDVQVGGGHYKGKAIQPVEFISANNLNFLEGCIVKRITRWRDKNGIEDLQKIKHEVDLLIAMEQKYGNAGK
jgi:Protein of unknwon function (DUF3310)